MTTPTIAYAEQTLSQCLSALDRSLRDLARKNGRPVAELAGLVLDSDVAKFGGARPTTGKDALAVSASLASELADRSAATHRAASSLLRTPAPAGRVRLVLVVARAKHETVFIWQYEIAKPASLQLCFPSAFEL